MLQPVREPGLAFEVREKVLGHRALVRNLEGHLQAVDGIQGFVHGRDRAFRKPPFDPVFAELLSFFQGHECQCEIRVVARARRPLVSL